MDSWIQIIALSLLLGTACITDIRYQKIPNLLVLTFFAAGIIYRVTCGGLIGLWGALIASACGFIPLLIIYLFKGIGAGDVKLFAAIGIWSSTVYVLQLMLISFLAAGIIGLVILISKSIYLRRFILMLHTLYIPALRMNRKGYIKWADAGKKFPFMIAVMPAFILVNWVLEPIIIINIPI